MDMTEQGCQYACGDPMAKCDRSLSVNHDRSARSAGNIHGHRMLSTLPCGRGGTRRVSEAESERQSAGINH